MTFNGQVPAPMLRVRQGDTVTLTLRNDRHSATWHSVDLHAVYGPGGGADPLTVLPGESKTIIFKTMYPGAFIYHCGVGRDGRPHRSRDVWDDRGGA
jgi:nitrite reductase (NO-forming)